MTNKPTDDANPSELDAAIEVYEQCDFVSVGEPDYCPPIEYIKKWVPALIQAAQECQTIKDECYRLACANIELRAENDRLKNACSSYGADTARLTMEISRLKKQQPEKVTIDDLEDALDDAVNNAEGEIMKSGWYIADAFKKRYPLGLIITDEYVVKEKESP
jgi:hypothetical protein